MRIARTAIVLASLIAAAIPAFGADDAEHLPIAAVTIYPGQTISDDMLADREYPAGTLERYPMFADRASLVGKVAKRTLIAGKPIANNAISQPDVIARGTIVQATYRTAEVEITTPVLALQAGSLNSVIQVRNVDTGKVITGIVQADGSVRVGGP